MRDSTCHSWLRWPCLLLVLAIPACGPAAPTTTPKVGITDSSPAVKVLPNQSVGGIYVIGPGDVLDIFVYQSPELSVTGLPVRPDGRISSPLIPDITASGKTSTELAHEIAERLKQYVKDPNVTVMVRTFVGPFNRQIRVIGEAAEPSAIPFRDHMTLLDVMIETKGLTKFAAGNRAIIVRHVGNETKTIHVHLSNLMKDGDISQNVEMEPGDTLIIPQSWF